jgi:hypothetical protein
MGGVFKPPAFAGPALLVSVSFAAGSLALAGGFAPTAAAQTAPPTTTPPSVTQAEVRPSPIHAIPDAPAEAPDGASALGDSVAPSAATLNAQMAALRHGAAEAQALRAADQTAAAAAIGQASPAATVAIARRVMDAAAAFDAYVHRASAIGPDVHEGADVAKAVLVGAAYEPQQFQEGAIAYAALAALQDAAFVQGVSDLGQDPVVRRELVRRLLTSPETALQLPAAREAGALVVSVIGRLGDNVISTGAAVKQASYTMQLQAWSKGPIDAPETLLASVKTQSATKVVLAPADAPALITNIVSAGKLGLAPQARSTAPTATVARGLALAALAVLGAAGDESADQLTPVLSETTNAQCLKMAKLDLNQCLAVAGPHYEGMFCLGRHGLMETGQCVVSAVGWTAAAPAAPPSRSILVPIALASLGGPERDSVMDGRAAVMPPPPAPAPAQPTPIDYTPPAPVAAAPAANPVFRQAYAMATPPAPVASLTAPSRWRPNGPQPGDSFVGGPYGAPAPAASPGGLAYGDAQATPTSRAYGYGYGPPTD